MTGFRAEVVIAHIAKQRIVLGLFTTTSTGSRHIHSNNWLFKELRLVVVVVVAIVASMKKLKKKKAEAEPCWNGSSRFPVYGMDLL